MSFNLYWNPVVKHTGTYLPYALKRVLGRRYFGHDGTLRGEAEFSKSDLSYLAGLRDASFDGSELHTGAVELIEAIETHGVVRVWIGESDD